MQSHYPQEQLQPGDVLLSLGHGELSSAIKTLDEELPGRPAPL